MRWILERSKEYRQYTSFCFIDYTKALDCVDYSAMWKTLRDMGFPEHHINLMKNLYENQETTICLEFGNTENFKIKKGVGQGCILSPALCNLYAESVMIQAGYWRTWRREYE